MYYFCFQIGRNLLARKVTNSQGTMCYIGRKRAGTDLCTTVQFPDVESINVKMFAENFLALHEKEKTSGKKPVDFVFNIKGDEVTSSQKSDTTRTKYFWDKPLEQLSTVKLGIAFNEKQGDFQLCINKTVSAEVSQKNRAWIGPVVDFSTSEMKNMILFL